MAIKRLDKVGVPYEQAPKRFIMDSEADVAKLPACCPGSTAVSAEGGMVYMVNASGAWVKTGVAAFALAEEVGF